jgi:hypothetical protein
MLKIGMAIVVLFLLVPSMANPTGTYKKYMILRHVDSSTMAYLLQQVGVPANVIEASPFPTISGSYGMGYGGGGYGGYMPQ